MEGVQGSYSSAISQLPQPSRPIGIDYSNIYGQCNAQPSHVDYQEFDHQESGEQYMERAQHGNTSAMPSRPIDIDYMNMFEQSYPTQFYGGYYECYNQESRGQYVSDDDLFRIFGEVAQEHDGNNGQEIFRKFFSKVKKEVHFDRLEKFYRLVNPENNLNPPGYEGRGINIDASSLTGDIKHKLERFRIKNLNLGGVVKEEKQN